MIDSLNLELFVITALDCDGVLCYANKWHMLMEGEKELDQGTSTFITNHPSYEYYINDTNKYRSSCNRD